MNDRRPLTIHLQGAQGGNIFAKICKYVLKREAGNKGYNFVPFDDQSGDPYGLDSISYPGINGNFEGQQGNVGFSFYFQNSDSKKIWSKLKEVCKNAYKNYNTNQIDLLIFVTPENFQKEQQKKFDRTVKDLNLPFLVQHYGQDDLDILFIQYPEMIGEYYPDLFPSYRLIIDEFREISKRTIEYIKRLPTNYLYDEFLARPEEDKIFRWLDLEPKNHKQAILISIFGEGKTVLLTRIVENLLENDRLIPLFCTSSNILHACSNLKHKFQIGTGGLLLQDMFRTLRLHGLAPIVIIDQIESFISSNKIEEQLEEEIFIPLINEEGILLVGSRENDSNIFLEKRGLSEMYTLAPLNNQQRQDLFNRFLFKNGISKI